MVWSFRTQFEDNSTDLKETKVFWIAEKSKFKETRKIGKNHR